VEKSLSFANRGLDVGTPRRICITWANLATGDEIDKRVAAGTMAAWRRVYIYAVWCYGRTVSTPSNVHYEPMTM